MAKKLSNLPVLEGWVNLTEAAEMLGITRQHAWRRAKLKNDGKPGGWKTIHRLEGTRYGYVVSVSEILDELSKRENPKQVSG